MRPFGWLVDAMTKRLLVGVLGAGLVLAACGSTSTPSTGPSSGSATPTASNAGGTADACLLLTKAQVGTALGVVVSDGRPLVPTSTLLCGWSEAAAAPGAGRRVTLTISTERAFTLGLTPITGITKTTVDDIGDAAYFVTASGLGTTLNVRKGTAAFAVAVLAEGALSPDDTMAAERALAVEVLAHI